MQKKITKKVECRKQTQPWVAIRYFHIRSITLYNYKREEEEEKDASPTARMDV